MPAEPAARPTVLLEILGAQDAQLRQDHVLDHAAMALGHDEDVRRDGDVRRGGGAGLPAHQVMIDRIDHLDARSEEHTSELQSLMRLSYAVFCLKKQNHNSPTSK